MTFQWTLLKLCLQKNEDPLDLILSVVCLPLFPLLVLISLEIIPVVQSVGFSPFSPQLVSILQVDSEKSWCKYILLLNLSELWSCVGCLMKGHTKSLQQSKFKNYPQSFSFPMGTRDVLQMLHLPIDIFFRAEVLIIEIEFCVINSCILVWKISAETELLF